MNTTDDYFKLSLSYCKSIGLLEKWSHKTIITLSIQSREISIAVQSDIHEDWGLIKIYIPDIYRYKNTGEKRWNYHYISILTTECNYWWKRFWFMCPKTWNRCWVLYIDEWGGLGSRTSKQLVYPQQIEPRSHRWYREMLWASMDDIMELRGSIKYPYRNWKPTRKQRKLLKISRDDEVVLRAYRENIFA